MGIRAGFHKALGLVLVGLCCIMVSCPAYGQGLSEESQKPLRVVMDNRYPPYAFVDDNGSLQGILVDQWNLWAQKTGRPVELTGMDWNDALKAMEEGRFDVIDTIFKNPQREMQYTFTKPYAAIPVPIYFSNMISGIKDVRSLKGFTVAAKRGDNAIAVLRENGISSVVEYPSYEAIIQAAVAKEILVFVVDEPPARYFMAKYGISEAFNASEPLYAGAFHRAVKKGDAALLADVEAGFAAMTEAEKARIEKRWYGTPLIPRTAYKWLLVILVSAVALVSVLVMWNRILRHRIADKTKDLALLLKEVRSSETRNRALLSAVPDMIFVLDREGRFLDYQAAKNEALYVPPEAFLSRTIGQVFPEEIALRMMTALERLAITEDAQVVDYQLLLGAVAMDFEARLVPGEDGRVLAIVRDVSEQKQKERQIYQMSVEDQLTGVFNRNHFESELMHYQTANERSVGVILCDLDGLKLVNDTLGHEPGDQCLKATAAILKRQIGRRGTVSRIGGDEFGILIPDTTQEELELLRQRVLKGVTEYNNSHNSYPISLSFGISVARGTFAGVHDSVKEADARMYRDKLTHKQNTRGEFLKIVKTMLLERESDFVEHAESVKRLSVRFGKILGLESQELKDLELLAEFHDVGKIAVGDATLQKRSEPSELEWLELKRHAEIGFRIAEATPDLRHIGEFILKHHERWDGTGYPLGISGEEIPLICRILSIADAYDTMTRNRAYRGAMPPEEAAEEIRMNAGQQFDPHLTAVFLEKVLPATE